MAGLHTRGKHHLARAENIRRCTDGCHEPAGLDERACPLEETMPPREVPLAPADAAPEGDIALLLNFDDLHPESLPLGRARVVGVGGLITHAEGASEQFCKADAEAMADALARAGAHFACPSGSAHEGWAGGLPVVAAWAPVDPNAEALPAGCVRVRRAWDEAAWPLSTRGYARLRGAIPRIMHA